MRGTNMKHFFAEYQSELEEKEMEAWQNLVRVLTHEIMNSVTPISSLAGTMEDEIRDHVNAPENKTAAKDNWQIYTCPFKRSVSEVKTRFNL